MRISGMVCLFCAVALCILSAAPAVQAEGDKIYYGIEMGGVLCGYSEIDTSSVAEDGAELLVLKQKSFLMISALGSEFNADLRFTYRIDPATGMFVYHDSDITQGQTRLGSVIHVRGDTAHFTASDESRTIAVALPPDAVLENTIFFTHLKRDFVDRGLNEQKYQVYEVRDAEIQETTYTKVGAERLEMAGKDYDAVILEELNHKTGLKLKWWIDSGTGQLLKAIHPNDRMSYLADASVVRKIEIATLDDAILSKTNVSIADVQGITYMKVRASIEPTGLWITPESLNVPGQSFTGKVEDNLVEGVFEIEHERYEGSGAPPFPPDFSSDELPAEYLEPAHFIESDDEVLIDKAMEITEGSSDSWEAACRLSEWVAENISYSIPGGGTARKTYDLRAGECGAHSMLLAAFCRAVGIPARVVWGCMYVPNAGGSFGQHGWSEIYMGDAGWITVDATAMETDYVDSGHIRVGELRSAATALNPREMEVLDYRVGTGESSEADLATLERFEPYVGDYTNKSSGRKVKIAVEDGSLTVDIQDQMKLAFNDPDEEGKWYCKLAGHVFCTFEEDESGEVSELKIHEMVTMHRQSGADSTDAGAPEEIRPYLGKYFLAAANAVFTVIHHEGGLAIEDPLNKETIRLQPPDGEGRWVDEYNKNAASFEFDDEGNVTALVIDVAATFSR